MAGMLAGIEDIIVIAIGLIVFFAALLLALKNNENDLGKLAHGELRKIITIVFTVIYIILLPYYFFNIYTPNATNITIINLTTQSSQSQTFNLTANSVPAMAVTDLLKNFLYVYIFIIIFYFTSRSIDGYSDAKKTDALKDKTASEIAEMRYARGKIDDNDLEKIKDGLLKTELITNTDAIEQIRVMRATEPKTKTKEIAKKIGYTEEAVKRAMKANNIE
jgi:uncharacterized membrane protein